MIFRNLMLIVLLVLFLSIEIKAEIICETVKNSIYCYSTSIASSKTSKKEKIVKLIRREAERFGIDPDLALKVAKIESDLNPKAISSKGAIGVMQLTLETAKTLGVNPYDLEENIRGGIAYLKYLLDKYKGDVDLALAAYNAGPSAVDKYGGIPPYTETLNYIQKIRGSLPALPKSNIRKIRLPDGSILYTNLPYVGKTE